jgi:hypothetical protein
VPEDSRRLIQRLEHRLAEKSATITTLQFRLRASERAAKWTQTQLNQQPGNILDSSLRSRIRDLESRLAKDTRQLVSLSNENCRLKDLEKKLGNINLEFPQSSTNVESNARALKERALCSIRDSQEKAMDGSSYPKVATVFSKAIAVCSDHSNLEAPWQLISDMAEILAHLALQNISENEPELHAVSIKGLTTQETQTEKKNNSSNISVEDLKESKMEEIDASSLRSPTASDVVSQHAPQLKNNTYHDGVGSKQSISTRDEEKDILISKLLSFKEENKYLKLQLEKLKMTLPLNTQETEINVPELDQLVFEVMSLRTENKRLKDSQSKNENNELNRLRRELQELRALKESQKEDPFDEAESSEEVFLLSPEWVSEQMKLRQRIQELECVIANMKTAEEQIITQKSAEKSKLETSVKQLCSERDGLYSALQHKHQEVEHLKDHVRNAVPSEVTEMLAQLASVVGIQASELTQLDQYLSLPLLQPSTKREPSFEKNFREKLDQHTSWLDGYSNQWIAISTLPDIEIVGNSSCHPLPFLSVITNLTTRAVDLTRTISDTARRVADEARARAHAESALALLQKDSEQIAELRAALSMERIAKDAAQERLRRVLRGVYTYLAQDSNEGSVRTLVPARITEPVEVTGSLQSSSFNSETSIDPEAEESRSLLGSPSCTTDEMLPANVTLTDFNKAPLGI